VDSGIGSRVWFGGHGDDRILVVRIRIGVTWNKEGIGGGFRLGCPGVVKEGGKGCERWKGQNDGSFCGVRNNIWNRRFWRLDRRSPKGIWFKLPTEDFERGI
jgi:hypothetical protein